MQAFHPGHDHRHAEKLDKRVDSGFWNMRAAVSCGYRGRGSDDEKVGG